MSLALSVVIPTWRRVALLERCLDAVLNQSLSAARYEVIVADDANDAATRALCARLRAERGGQVNLRWLAVGPRHGPAAARNCGWRAALAPIVAFTDDDTVPERDWLAAGLRRCTPDVAAVSGRVLVPLRAPCSDFARNMAGLASAEFVTANCFVTRAWLERAGGFDERFTLAWREDSDLQFTLLGLGARIVAVDDARVLHPVRGAPWWVSIAQQARIRFDALLYKKHPRLYRERIHRQPRWRYYAIVAALLIALAAALAGQGTLALVAGGAWLLASLAFCATRLAHSSRHWRHVLAMLVTSLAIPPVAVFWRLVGAARWRTPLW